MDYLRLLELTDEECERAAAALDQGGEHGLAERVEKLRALTEPMDRQERYGWVLRDHDPGDDL